jgi:hypothetical protein
MPRTPGTVPWCCVTRVAPMAPNLLCRLVSLCSVGSQGRSASMALKVRMIRTIATQS